jgi:hypothetical protein
VGTAIRPRIFRLRRWERLIAANTSSTIHRLS